jgi:hypothetical protein
MRRSPRRAHDDARIEEQLASLETRLDERRYLEAHGMAASFNMWRANDLIWSFICSAKNQFRSTSFLELWLDADARGDALVLSAQHVPAQFALEAAGFSALYAGGPYRAVEVDRHGHASWFGSGYSFCWRPAYGRVH